MPHVLNPFSYSKKWNGHFNFTPFDSTGFYKQNIQNIRYFKLIKITISFSTSTSALSLYTH